MSSTGLAVSGMRWFKRAVLGLIALLILYQLWLFGWVLWWSQVNPDMTRFMDIRLAELRLKNPKAELSKQWVPYNRISTHLKRALVVSEDDLFVPAAFEFGCSEAAFFVGEDVFLGIDSVDLFLDL